MGNYWILSAGKDGELWPAFWTEHRIAIGWPALGDLREYNNYEALREAMARHHPGESVSTLGQWAGAVWRFYRDLQKDELVFIRSYTSLLGIAIVSSDYD